MTLLRAVTIYHSKYQLARNRSNNIVLILKSDEYKRNPHTTSMIIDYPNEPDPKVNNNLLVS